MDKMQKLKKKTKKQKTKNKKYTYIQILFKTILYFNFLYVCVFMSRIPQ